MNKKKKYETPLIEVFEIKVNQPFMESSYGPKGGKRDGHSLNIWVDDNEKKLTAGL